MSRTIVHLVRHGEVFNPEGILYGRLDGFHLSERGKAMAAMTADALKERDLVHLVSSPLERAQETIAPLAAATGLTPELDERVLESVNLFEGHSFTAGGRALLKVPHLWRHLYNPLKPSWGEPYREISARMMSAVHDARKAAEGHEAVIVSHQLPIWTTRLFLERRSNLVHPKRRQCTLCSVSSLHFDGDRFTHLVYTEPAISLIPRADRDDPFSAGGNEPAGDR